MTEWKLTGARTPTYVATLHGISLKIIAHEGQWKWWAGWRNGIEPLNSAAKRAAINSAIDQKGL